MGRTTRAAQSMAASEFEAAVALEGQALEGRVAAAGWKLPMGGPGRRARGAAEERRRDMKDQVNRVEYFALTVDDRAGEGAQLGNKLAKEGVNLLALSAFPSAPGKTQVDIVPEHPEALIKAAKKLNLSIGSPKACFYVQGTDRPGAMAEIIGRLGDARINVRASLGACAGGNRYGALLWVAPGEIDAAGRALGATTMSAH